MSIKQQGGVFGRNPTFNDVTIEGQLTFDGDIDINSDLKVSGAVEATTSYASTSIAVGNPANYQATFYMPGANANYVQVVNGMTGAGPINGILYGLDASGNGVLNKQGNGDLITTVAGVERLRILEAGTFDVSAANIAFDSGYGIDFSATSGTGTSELLDDYEEGTWTPVIEGTTSGSLSFGTVTRAAYSKIGNLIYANCYLSSGNLAAHNIVGAVKVSGLPFVSESYSGMVNICLSNIFLIDASDTSISGYAESSHIRLTKGAGAVSLTGSDVVSAGTSGQIMLQIVYQQ